MHRLGAPGGPGTAFVAENRSPRPYFPDTLQERQHVKNTFIMQLLLDTGSFHRD